jgi:hypothetical protein
MSKLEDIEAAVAELAPREFERFRAWFDEFQSARFDEKIARDAENGRLDRLADTAAAEHRKGRTREL